MVPGFSSIEHRRRISVTKVTLETVKSIKYKNTGRPFIPEVVPEGINSHKLRQQCCHIVSFLRKRLRETSLSAI
jgi:hypothetical protein